MELARYVDSLRQELSGVVETGDEATRELAARLVTPLSSAVRLTLLDALSAAADEITQELSPGAVEIRLRGLDPTFVVTLPAPEQRPDEDLPHDMSHPTHARNGMAPSMAPLTPVTTAEEGSTSATEGGAPTKEESAPSRINFRPPEHLKARIEAAAGRERLSVNAWLVRSVSGLLDAHEHDHRPERRAPRGTPGSSQSFTGWVT
ncbi:hypothetical protein [Streptomyces silvensis]|uniref:Histidine kinase n=1 Tax=Streptomyces silvensis TaxID=1765722 RepID=A0A0W7X6R6_9ACTN|nr:hypothetical protein [Streptomyces silvensis]KUF18394.1 histidine kinase [Streptomyces silvensis]